MKEKTFRRVKKGYEKKLGRELTDEEVEEMQRRDQWKYAKIIFPFCLIMGLAMAADWPGPWAPFDLFLSLTGGQFLGLIMIIVSIVGFILNYLKHKEKI
jgi:polyferredoxin